MRCRKTGMCGAGFRMTTRRRWELRRGGTFCFWSSLLRRDRKSRTRADPFRWVFLSDVCKHCANAGCLEACPTGSIVRTEFGGVFVQKDVCNGCGYCVVTCPFGVIDKRYHDDGRAFKCTFCYDRQKVGLMPACATACPTESIQFGEMGELKERGKNRVAELKARGYGDARLYDPTGTSGRWDSCDFGDSGRAGGVQLAAGAGGADFVFEECVDFGVCFGGDIDGDCVGGVCDAAVERPREIHHRERRGRRERREE